MSSSSQPQQQQTKPPPGPGGYEVSRARGVCATCQVQIEGGAPLMAVLRETATGFERVDVCPACWPTFERGPDVVGFWRTVMPRAEQKKKLFVDDEVLCQLLERLAETTDAGKLNFRFVLGLILMRKRLIVYEGSEVRDGQEVWQVRFKGKDQVMDLLNPRLDEEQIKGVSEQLGQVLNEEL